MTITDQQRELLERITTAEDPLAVYQNADYAIDGVLDAFYVDAQQAIKAAQSVRNHFVRYAQAILEAAGKGESNASAS